MCDYAANLIYPMLKFAVNSVKYYHLSVNAVLKSVKIAKFGYRE